MSRGEKFHVAIYTWTISLIDKEQLLKLGRELFIYKEEFDVVVERLKITN